MGKALDAAAVERFHRDGFYAPVPVAAREDALRMRAQLESYEAEHGGPLKGSVRFKSHLLFKWLAGLHPLAAGSSIRSRTSSAPTSWSGPRTGGSRRRTRRAMSPGTRTASTGGLDSDKLLTVWVALSRSNIASGCMRYLPGSHFGTRPAPPRDLPWRQHAHAGTGNHRRHRRVQSGERRAGTGRGFDLRVPYRARIASQPHRRPPHRSGRPLHSARCASGAFGPRQRGAGAGGRHPRSLRAGAANRSSTSTRTRSSSTGGRRRNAARSSTTAPTGRHTGPETSKAEMVA